VRNAEMREITLELSADVRAGRYEPDMDLGKSEYFGEAQELATAYQERARPILAAFLARGLISREELAAHATLGHDRHVLADRLQALAETLPPDGP
jgi:hypothetical protein